MRITGPAGWCIGFLVAGFIEAKYGWQSAFFIAGLPGLLLALAGYFLLYEPRRGAVDGHHLVEIPKWHEGLTLLKSSKFLVYIIGAMAFSLALGALGDWGPAFLHRAYGLTNLQATTFFAYGWLFFQATGGIIGGILGSYLKRHFVHGYLYQLGIALVFAAGLLFHGLLSNDLQTTENFIRAEMFFAGLSMGAVATVMMDLVAGLAAEWRGFNQRPGRRHRRRISFLGVDRNHLGSLRPWRRHSCCANRVSRRARCPGGCSC